MKLQSSHFFFNVPMQFPADFIALHEGHLYSHLKQKISGIKIIIDLPMIGYNVSSFETITTEIVSFKDSTRFTCNIPLLAIGYQEDIFC